MSIEGDVENGALEARAREIAEHPFGNPPGGDGGPLPVLLRGGGDEGPDAALDVDLNEHFALPGDAFARQHFGDFFERDLVPPMQADALRTHDR